MNNVSFIKRLFVQLINYLNYYLLGFGVLLTPFVLNYINLPLYLILSIVSGILFHWILGSLITFASKYLSIGGAMFKVKIVSAEEKNPKFSQILVRTVFESVLVLLILDYFHLLFRKTSRSAIDRASSTFLIDISE